MDVKVFLERGLKVRLVRVWRVAEGVYFVYMWFSKRVDLVGFGGKEEGGTEYTTVIVGGVNGDDSIVEVGFEGDYHYDFWCWKDVCEGVLIRCDLYSKVVNSKPLVSVER